MSEQQSNKRDPSMLTDSNIQEPMLRKENRFDGLNNMSILGYGVGHFINDLVAACWFNYLFFFLKRVVQTPAASTAILSGQIFDGLATPIVGYISDKYSTRFGQRTPWYIFGLVLVAICYVPIYHTFHAENVAWEYVYYITFPSLFNIGWASLQISHMSLVPSLSCSRKRRDKLNNLRNTFTFVANLTVLGMGLVIFKFMSDPELQYAIISYIVVTIGIAASVFFLYQVKQVPLTRACHEKADALKQEIIRKRQQDRTRPGSNTEFSDDDDGGVHFSKQKRLQKVESIKDWFKMPKFYLFGICYMGVRLYTNMFGTLLPFYLVGVLHLGTEQEGSTQVPFTVALVPLIVYLTSVLTSFNLNWFYAKFGRKMALLVGTIICVLAMGSMFFLTVQTNWVMYIISAFIGVSQTLVLSTGINFISDVVGSKAKTGAFVFGIYSLLDKFSSGAVIYLIGATSAYTVEPADLTPDEVTLIKYTMILIPSLSTVLATVIVMLYPVQQYKVKVGEDGKKGLTLEDELVN